MYGVGSVRGPRAWMVLGRIFLVLGLVGLAAAVVLASIEWRGKHTASASGKIAMIGKLSTFEFTTADGSIVRFTNAVRSSFWQAGDDVAIAYDPGNPSDAVIDSLAGRWFLPGLAGLFGGVFLVIGGVLTSIGRRAIRRLAAN